MALNLQRVTRENEVLVGNVDVESISQIHLSMYFILSIHHGWRWTIHHVDGWCMEDVDGVNVPAIPLHLTPG